MQCVFQNIQYYILLLLTKGKNIKKHFSRLKSILTEIKYKLILL